MNNKVILSTTKVVEPTSFGKITHRISDKFRPLPEVYPFRSFLALQEFFLKPGLGILPHTHEDVTAILIPLSGSLTQRSLKDGNTTITKGEVQLLCYEKGDMHLEYNQDKKENLDCLVFALASKNKENCTEIFKLTDKPNTISKVFDSKLINDQEKNISFYFVNYNAGVHKTHTFHNNKKGAIIYMVYGKIMLHNDTNSPILKNRDTLAIWNESTITFTTHQNSKFFILELS
ncbi:pirin family protein [Marixanthomonas spongiae]|uniref:Quercetin 2,3-dioxygenase C-terminal cupin domain-containing protein n=1 Tax=Marixanthomonas spongiae TaxID=2174845 RepID=A0A2U0HVH5_9FLAO|nr:hypothetical protein [Marixanthomonas spongiae]PVW12836.1 hypothetical protein DDV96_14520 [Marixanthomonas spongiae]